MDRAVPAALSPCLLLEPHGRKWGGGGDREGTVPYTAPPGPAARNEALPDHTALGRHLQAAVPRVPWALGDEPRVPVCSEPLGTEGVAEPKAADTSFTASPGLLARPTPGHTTWAPPRPPPSQPSPWTRGSGGSPWEPGQAGPQAPLPGGGGTMRGEDPARAGPGAWFVGAAKPALCLPQS